MPDQIERGLRRLEAQLPGRVSLPGEDGYAAATAIWAKPVGLMPRAVVPASCGAPPKVRFASDSPLEESGFELMVPPRERNGNGRAPAPTSIRSVKARRRPRPSRHRVA